MDQNENTNNLTVTQDSKEIPTLASIERKHIEYVLNLFGGNKPEAAKVLGVSVKTLYNKLNAYAKEDATPKEA